MADRQDKGVEYRSAESAIGKELTYKNKRLPRGGKLSKPAWRRGRHLRGVKKRKSERPITITVS